MYSATRTLKAAAAFALGCVALAFATFASDSAAKNKTSEALSPLALKVDAALVPAINLLHNGKSTDVEVTRGLLSVSRGGQFAYTGSRIPLTLDVHDLAGQTLHDIAATGAHVSHFNAQWNSVSLSASVAEIDALAKIPGVRLIHIAGRPHTRQAGISPNQADADLNADKARQATGLTGAGQKIGVLSNSINQTAIGPGTITGTVPNAVLSGLTNQNSGDIPSSVQVIDFGPNDVIATDGQFTDEGAAMMELIHDIAPNAALAFASAYSDQTGFAENIIKLGQAGCTITCDDVGYFEEPYFQDGPIAQAIAANYALGIPHFSATGNDYDNGIMGTYTPVNPAHAADNELSPPDGNDFHDFGLAGTPAGYLPIDLQPGRSLTPILQWNQPFQSYGLGPGASVDLDMYLFDAPSPAANVLAKSENTQFGGGIPGGDPLEEFNMGLGYVNNSNSTQRVYLAINHFAGSRANTFFRIVIVDRTGFSFPFGGAGAISIYGHTASNQCIGCAAIYSAEIESGVGYGADSTHIHVEAFSSKGGSGVNGIPYFFDAAGNALPGAPIYRNKPDITAVDGCNTTFFTKEFHALLNGNYYPPLSDTLPSFFGTSAAAPNAAAVAALMKERAPLSTPDQIKKALQATARLSVLNVPVTPPDRIGAGLIDAYAAIQAVPTVLTNPSDQTVPVTQSATFSVAANGAATLSYQWQRNGITIPGANAPAYTLASVTTADSQAHFACLVSNAYGTLISKPATLVVDTPPVITSAPFAFPILVRTGAPVTFTAGATSALGLPLTYTWTFGDGGSASGANVAYIYAAPQAYTVTVTATDSLGLAATAMLTVTAYADSDADGFPDVNPDADNAGYADFAEAINDLLPMPLTVTKLKIHLNFLKPAGNDILVLHGSLPVPAGFSAEGRHVIVLAGGYGREFVLDKHGRAARVPNGSFHLKFNANTKKDQIGKYALRLSKATIQKFFAANGLTDKTITGEKDFVRVTIFFHGGMYDTIRPQSYSAKQGKYGKTK